MTRSSFLVLSRVCAHATWHDARQYPLWYRAHCARPGDDRQELALYQAPCLSSLTLTTHRYGLIDEDAAAFWRAYRFHLSEGQLQVALVDKFNTTIRRRFELVRNEHARLAGTASAEAEMAAKMYGYHRATIERMVDPQVSLEGAGSRVTLRATGGGPNGYQGFTDGVHGEDADRMITALSYIVERYGEPSDLGMNVWRLKPGAQMLSRDRNRDYNLLHEGFWRPNSFFAFAGCHDSWHCGTWDVNRCDVETSPPLYLLTPPLNYPVINRAKVC